MIDLQQDSEESSSATSITLISGTEVEVQTWEYGEATSLLTWTPKGFSNRDLDAPALFVERVALEVLQFPSSDLAHRDGLQLQNGRVRAVRHMEFRHVHGDAPERAAILSLPHLARAALCASALPIDSSPWPVTLNQIQAINEILKDCLMKHGGLKLKGNVKIGVSGEEFVELSGKFRPKPDLSSPTTEPGELIGRVTGHHKGKEVIWLMNQDEHSLEIRFGKTSLVAETFSKLEDDRTPIAVQVEIGTDRSGKPEYHYVSHALYVGVSSLDAVAEACAV